MVPRICPCGVFARNSLHRSSSQPFRVEGFGDAETRIGLLVDVETTGLYPDQDKIIELAMVPFRYTLNGNMAEVLDPFDPLREPAKPISPEIVALTGITDAMVSGQSIDPSGVRKFTRKQIVPASHLPKLCLWQHAPALYSPS